MLRAFWSIFLFLFLVLPAQFGLAAEPPTAIASQTTDSETTASEDAPPAPEIPPGNLVQVLPGGIFVYGPDLRVGPDGEINVGEGGGVLVGPRRERQPLAPGIVVRPPTASGPSGADRRQEEGSRPQEPRGDGRRADDRQPQTTIDPQTGDQVSPQELQRRQRQRQQQEQLNQSMDRIRNGGGGGSGGGAGGGRGGGGSGGAGGGGGGGMGGGFGSNNGQNPYGQMQKIDPGLQQLQQLVAQSNQPDTNTMKMFQDLKTRSEEFYNTFNKNIPVTQIPDYSNLFSQVIAQLEKTPLPGPTNQQLLSNANSSSGRVSPSRVPLKVPSGIGLAAGTSSIRSRTRTFTIGSPIKRAIMFSSADENLPSPRRSFVGAHGR